MDELAALEMVGASVSAAGDDAAVIGDVVLTTDMLHERTDFPNGTTRYTAGWRAVGASLSDIAAMGASTPAALAVYAAPEFDWESLEAFLDGADSVCTAVGGAYVGGDLDTHQEFTVATTALGWCTEPGAPVHRHGATTGDIVYVTGSLGRSAAALELFDRGDEERANDLFRFVPRIDAGERVAPHASAMMDSSDGLARSLHQLASASDCGFEITADDVPVASELEQLATQPLERALHFGEDFELVCTCPDPLPESLRSELDVRITAIGTVSDRGVNLDGTPLEDRGYTHGRD